MELTKVKEIDLKDLPREVKDLDCRYYSISNLKGCPNKITGLANLSDNSNLKDISDLPKNCDTVVVSRCDNLETFTTEIDTKLRFLHPTDKVRQRIKSWPYYRVIGESTEHLFAFVDVVSINDNEVFMDSL